VVAIHKIYNTFSNLKRQVWHIKTLQQGKGHEDGRKSAKTLHVPPTDSWRLPKTTSVVF
jgi:hypothetical protein